MTTPLDAADLAVQLMSIDSTSGREGPAIEWLEALLRGRGWRTQLIPVTPGRHDLFAADSEAPIVTFSTHLDTVPPYIAPRRDERRIWGRGACDAKGIAAAMVCAAERLRERVPVALLFVVGEEVSHDGAHAANDAHRAGTVPTSSEILINGEPTQSTLAVGTKGAIRVIVRTEGRAAHSAYPQFGRSATLDLVSLLGELDRLELPRDPILGETTVNIGSLAGGVADNVLAPAAEARLMIRLVGPAEEVVAVFERWAAGRATLEWGVSIPAAMLSFAEGFGAAVAAFATDIPALTRWGAPYLFGPGSIHVAHRDEEFIDIAELDAAVDAYARLAIAAYDQRTAPFGVIGVRTGAAPLPTV
jgi:acetylornithine deacetylase